MRLLPDPAAESNSAVPMRVAIVSPCFGVLGGLETFVCTLAKALVAQPDVEVTFCFKKVKSFQFDPLLEKAARATGNGVVFVERASRALAAVIRNADIVQCQSPCFDVAVITKLFRKRLVLTMHSQRHRNPRPREIARMIAWHMADRRWYNSESNWNTWDLGCNGANSARLPVVSSLPAGRMPTGKRRGVVFVARWIGNKGIDSLVEAYARAILDRKQWPLILMGDGPLWPMIEAKSRMSAMTGAGSA